LVAIHDVCAEAEWEQEHGGLSSWDEMNTCYQPKKISVQTTKDDPTPEADECTDPEDTWLEPVLMDRVFALKHVGRLSPEESDQAGD